MKIYQSHKKVTAARITGYAALEMCRAAPFGGIELTLDDGSQVHVVGPEWNRAEIGGFYARDNDGRDFYVSAECFANSYMEVGEAPDALAEPVPPSSDAATVSHSRDAIGVGTLTLEMALRTPGVTGHQDVVLAAAAYRTYLQTYG